jgi:hypothetical protein
VHDQQYAYTPKMTRALRIYRLVLTITVLVGAYVDIYKLFDAVSFTIVQQ